jgi:hypothetical protein
VSPRNVNRTSIPLALGVAAVEKFVAGYVATWHPHEESSHAVSGAIATTEHDAVDLLIIKVLEKRDELQRIADELGEASSRLEDAGR